jgi:PAS domain S-box-containing protein
MSDSNPTQVGLIEAENILQQLAGAFSLVNPVVSRSSLVREPEEIGPEIDARYQTLIEQIPAVVFMAFLDKGIGEAYVSPQIEALLGFTQEEWLNDPVRWYQQIHPDDKERWSVEAAELFLLGEPLKSLYRVLSRDGRVVWFHCEAKMVRNQDGRPWFIHGVAFDISELKSAEEALKKSEEMLRGLFESAPDTVVVIDQHGEIVSVNGQVKSMFGYNAGDVIGKSIITLIPEATQLRGLWSDPENSSSSTPTGVELDGRRRDGTVFPIDITLNPMKGATNVVIAIVRDISRRRLAEEALRDYADRLQALSRRLMEVQELERRKIALELHDEIGQVLTGLKLTLEVTTRLPVNELGNSLNQARGLVNELMARVRNLSLDLRPAILDDFGLLPTLLWHFEHYTAQTQVKVNFKHSGLEKRRFSPDVETSAYRLVQEALTNVARHANVREVTVRVWTQPETLSIEVEDAGRGFDLKSVAGRETSGLAGMRERATLLGGQLRIDSQVGEGTKLVAEFDLESDQEPSSV